MMTDETEPATPSTIAKTATKDKSGKDNTKWIAAAAGMGIGSAALVAALMYANRGKPKKKG